MTEPKQAAFDDVSAKKIGPRNGRLHRRPTRSKNFLIVGAVTSNCRADVAAFRRGSALCYLITLRTDLTFNALGLPDRLESSTCPVARYLCESLEIVEVKIDKA